MRKIVLLITALWLIAQLLVADTRAVTVKHTSSKLRISESGNEGFVAGVMRDQHGKGMADTEIRLLRDGEIVGNVFSDNGGGYVINNVPAGDYILQIMSVPAAENGHHQCRACQHTLSPPEVVASRKIRVRKASLWIANLRIPRTANLSPHPNWEIAPGSIFIERPIPVAGAYVRPPMLQEQW
jgi:hypothetical protein